MHLTAEEVNKLKVVELRAELQVRGLDPKGVKAVLVDRLLAALSGSPGGGPAAVLGLGLGVGSVGNGAGAVTLDLSTASEHDDSKVEDVTDVPQVQALPATIISPIKVQPVQESTPAPPPVVVAAPQALAPVLDQSMASQPDEEFAEGDEEDVEEEAENEEEAEQEGEGEEGGDAEMAEAEEGDSASAAATAPAPAESTEKMETDHEQEGDTTKRKIEVINGESTDESKTKKQKTEEPIVFKNVPLNEPDMDENAVLLDWYKSDLNLKIATEDFLQAEPTIYEDFPFAYAGVKATYGFVSGKVCFEAKWAKSCEVRSDFGDKETKHVFRVGWSDVNADLQLGEDKLSMGYDVSGKLYNGGEIQDLGDALAEGDVVTAYLDLESDPVELKFSKNGTAVGEPVKVPKADLEGKALFPHVLVRNVKFEVNFGSKDAAHELLEGYEMVGKVEGDEKRVRGPLKPATKDDCELIMLVGLACSGKTKWAKDFIKNNPEKNYNILGTSTAVERALKDVSILTSQKAPRVFDSFFMKAGKFVERLVDIAPSRKRNYILDQSNVLPSVQRRKCGGFESFKRRAVVVLPTDEEYHKRIKSKEQEQGKKVPSLTILEMKASFRLPDVGELFAEVEFPELQREQAQELVTKYNKEGTAAGYGRNSSGRGGPRGGYRGRGGPFRGGRGAPRGHGGRPWRGGPPHRGGPMGGGGYGMRRGGPPHPPPMRIPRGPPVNMGGPPRGGGRGMAPMRSGMRGSGGPPPPQRGSLQPRGGSWSRGGGNNYSNNYNMNNSRGPPPPRGGRGGHRGGGGQMQTGGSGSGRWGSGPGGQHQQRPNQGGRMPQGGNFQPWAQNNWGGGRSGGAGNQGFGGGGFGGAIDPWVHQQVPDQGFGQSWDSAGGNSGNRGGTWQGYGGNTIGNAGRR